MSKAWISIAAVAVISCPAWAQKIEVQKQGREKIVHIETALNHLTVLEMTEPVITVAVGSSGFKVEWRENKVFIEPNDANVATNLFVWTASSRFSYELDPAGAVPQMDFAIDQPVVDPPAVHVSRREGARPTDESPEDVLIGEKPIRLYGTISEKNRIAVYLTDSLEHDGQVLIRYTIRNQTKTAYVPGDPQVVALNALRYRESLYALSNFQLSPGEAARLKCGGDAIPIEVTKGQIGSSRIEPGGETTGIVAIRLPQGHAEPALLRLIFLADPKGPVNATLVL